MALLVSRQDATYKHGRAPLEAWVSYNPTLPSCNPCNRSLLEAYSYRYSLLHSTRLNFTRPVPRRSKARHRVSSRSHTRIGLREQPFESFVSPPPPTHFLHRNIFPLQSRPPVKVALLGDCFLVHLAHMLNQAAVLDPLAPLFPVRAFTSNCLSCL
jgi:hypothetical protein